MRNRLKLAVAIGFACLLAIGVAACGGGSDSGGSTSGGSSGGKLEGKVTFWDAELESFPGYTKAAKQIDSEFEKANPGVTVDHVAVPYESWEAQYRAAFAAHEGPDLMWMSPGGSGVLSFTKGLEPINDRLTPDLEKNLTLWQTVTPGLKTEGERYGLPLTLGGWVFYYNKEMFKQAGLPAKFEPKTWDEVREAGEKLKAAGVQPFVGGTKGGPESSFWFGVGMQSSGTTEEASELAEGTMPYTDEAVTKALEPNIEMQEAGLYSNERFSTPWIPDSYAQFAEGKGAMILGFWSTVGYWGEFNPKLGEKNVGIFFPPGKDPVADYAGFALSIPTFSKNKEAAWALAEFYASKHSAEVLYEVAGYLPNRNDVTLPPNAPEQAVTLVEASREPSAIVAPFQALPSTVAYQSMPQEMDQVLQGRISLEEAQSNIQETAERNAG